LDRLWCTRSNRSRFEHTRAGWAVTKRWRARNDSLFSKRAPTYSRRCRCCAGVVGEIEM